MPVVVYEAVPAGAAAPNEEFSTTFELDLPASLPLTT